MIPLHQVEGTEWWFGAAQPRALKDSPTPFVTLCRRVLQGPQSGVIHCHAANLTKLDRHDGGYLR